MCIQCVVPLAMFIGLLVGQFAENMVSRAEIDNRCFQRANEEKILQDCGTQPGLWVLSLV